MIADRKKTGKFNNNYGFFISGWQTFCFIVNLKFKAIHRFVINDWEVIITTAEMKWFP